jgi:hypothetical protein
MEGRYLHPRQTAAGVWLFDPEELAQVPQRASKEEAEPEAARAASKRRQRVREGHLVAGIFQMFEAGESLPQIVIATRQQPERVRHLYREWVTSLNEGERQTRERERREQRGF